MKISLEWLGEFVTWVETDPRIIADRLTLSSAEVEEVEEQGKYLKNTCVGEVLSVSKHPDADRLSIAEVKTGPSTSSGQVKRVVCGGTNVTQGMLVAFAHIGATVKWHGGETVTLEPVKIRGVASEGMICAAEELGLEHLYKAQPEGGERPIMDLRRIQDAGFKMQVGVSLREALKQDDAVLHINNTAITIRPDLFSHLGFARECVALGLAKWKKMKPSVKAKAKNTTGASFKMIIDEPELVPRYLGCFLEIDRLGVTPDWMKKRLEAVGLRSINLPVDITNYVALEIGVPLHSFDAGDIKGDVHMRLSMKGEKITTLDGVVRLLPQGVLVLSDDNGVFDLVGIMGGLRSCTKETTKHIYLHAASLDAATVRRAILATAHRTDAATVYEKGVPPITAEQGFYRALELFTSLVPGARIVSAIEDKGNNGKPKPIKLGVSDVNNNLGTNLTEKEVTKILTDLGFDVKKSAGSKARKLESLFAITPPLHRLRDINGLHDLVEEIGRIHGFQNIPSLMPLAPLQLPERDQRIHSIRSDLKETGYIESVPLSFVSPALLKKCGMSASDAVAIANPLGEETSLLQPHTLPALLAHAEHQLTQSEHDLKTFQWGHVFAKDCNEHPELCMLIAAKKQTDLLHDPFLRIKQELLRAAKNAGYDLTVAPAKTIPDYAHPGRSANVLYRGDIVGMVYEVHPSVRARFDLPFRAAAATLNLSTLFKHPAVIPTAKPLHQFPAISYDVTIPRSPKDELGPLLKKLRTSSTLLEEVSVADIYDGKPLSGGNYNLTLRFTYRSPGKTLTEAEVKTEHQKIMKAM